TNDLHTIAGDVSVRCPDAGVLELHVVALWCWRRCYRLVVAIQVVLEHPTDDLGLGFAIDHACPRLPSEEVEVTHGQVWTVLDRADDPTRAILRQVANVQLSIRGVDDAGSVGIRAGDGCKRERRC